jgi:hypothetical protein
MGTRHVPRNVPSLQKQLHTMTIILVMIAIVAVVSIFFAGHYFSVWQNNMPVVTQARGVIATQTALAIYSLHETQTAEPTVTPTPSPSLTPMKVAASK